MESLESLHNEAAAKQKLYPFPLVVAVNFPAEHASSRPLMQTHCYSLLKPLYTVSLQTVSECRGGLSCIRYFYICNIFHPSAVLIHTHTPWRDFSYHWNLYLNNKCINLFNLCLYFLPYIIICWLYNYRKYMHTLHDYAVNEIMPAVEFCMCVCMHVYENTATVGCVRVVQS